MLGTMSVTMRAHHRHMMDTKQILWEGACPVWVKGACPVWVKGACPVWVKGACPARVNAILQKLCASVTRHTQKLNVSCYKMMNCCEAAHKSFTARM